MTEDVNKAHPKQLLRALSGMNEAEYTNDFFLDAIPDQIAALVNTLRVINSTLDRMKLYSGPTIVSAPPITILLQYTSTAPSSEPVTFVVHKTILWVHSSQIYVYIRGNRSKRVWEIDADEKPLGLMIDWMYHPDDVALEVLSTDRLLPLALSASLVDVRNLFNTVADILIARHFHPTDAFSPFVRFRPSQERLRGVYEKTDREHPLKRVIAYLRIRAKEPLSKIGDEVWEIEMVRDGLNIGEEVRQLGRNGVGMDRCFL
jgi:hypothetical protein